jgi:hypothetical protein
MPMMRRFGWVRSDGKGSSVQSGRLKSNSTALTAPSCFRTSPGGSHRGYTGSIPSASHQVWPFPTPASVNEGELGDLLVGLSRVPGCGTGWLASRSRHPRGAPDLDAEPVGVADSGSTLLGLGPIGARVLWFNGRPPTSLG